MDDECSVYNDRDEALVSNPLMGKLLQERWENNIRFWGRGSGGEREHRSKIIFIFIILIPLLFIFPDSWIVMIWTEKSCSMFQLVTTNITTFKLSPFSNCGENIWVFKNR